MNVARLKPERVAFLTDVLITAIEGGIGYWSGAADYDSDGDPVGRGVTLHATGVELSDLSPGYLSVRDRHYLPPNAGGDDWILVRVALQDIARGLHRIAERQCGTSEETGRIVRRANHSNDCCTSAGDVDADVADCVVQAALFGRLIFG